MVFALLPPGSYASSPRLYKTLCENLKTLSAGFIFNLELHIHYGGGSQFINECMHTSGHILAGVDETAVRIYHASSTRGQKYPHSLKKLEEETPF